MTASTLNWKEIDLVLQELALDGSLIQEIHQPSHERLSLDLFREGDRFSILLSLSARYPRIHLLTEKLANPAKPPRFASFLRAHLRGGRIESAVQVAGERIVRISVRKEADHRILWLRLWSSAANAVVTDAEGKILDAFYRRPKKGEVSGRTFEPLGAAVIPAGTAGAQSAARPRKNYEVRDLPGEGTFNEKVELFFRDLETRGDQEKLLAEAQADLAVRESKVLANIEKLEARLVEYRNLERFKELGDLVMASLHAISRGDRWIRTEDFFHDNAPVEIELKEELSPVQNAEHYYERYRKARLGLGKVEEEVRSLRIMLKKIQARQAAIAENPETATLGKAAAAAGPRLPPDTPGLVFHSPPFQIIVGRSAAENDELLRRRVRGNDWWFHARDWPGAYVFVKAQAGKTLPLETMIDAGNLAIHFSKGKLSGRGDVYYTQVKYLRRAKGAKKGTVLPTQEKNIHIKLEPERIERLKTSSEAAAGSL